MKLMICGSMSFSDRMLEVRGELEKAGHTVLVSSFVERHRGLSVAESEAQAVVEKNGEDAMRVDFEKLHHVDGIVVLNYDKRGIANYIGGNTFLEMGLAHVLDRKIFLLNPIPEIPIYQSEIIAMKPVILLGDITKIA